MIGFLGDLQGNQVIDWELLGGFTVFTVIGIFIGIILSKKMPGKKFKKAFGWFVLIMGFYIIVKEIFIQQEEVIAMEKNQAEEYCVVTSDVELRETFWNNQYNANTTSWDLGQVSPPIKDYVDQLTNKDLRILIPGCGNSYEADYLLQKGFTNITLIDIAPTLVRQLQQKFINNLNIKIIQTDFFTHDGEYDLILEQTFFCAINPLQRKDYVVKMKAILATNGKLVGVLFDKEFEQQGPPFGGCQWQYKPLFENDFNLKTFEPCHNSFAKRQGTELFINLVKK